MKLCKQRIRSCKNVRRRWCKRNIGTYFRLFFWAKFSISVNTCSVQDSLRVNSDYQLKRLKKIAKTAYEYSAFEVLCNTAALKCLPFTLSNTHSTSTPHAEYLQLLQMWHIESALSSIILSILKYTCCWQHRISHCYLALFTTWEIMAVLTEEMLNDLRWFCECPLPCSAIHTAQMYSITYLHSPI